MRSGMLGLVGGAARDVQGMAWSSPPQPNGRQRNTNSEDAAEALPTLLNTRRAVQPREFEHAKLPWEGRVSIPTKAPSVGDASWDMFPPDYTQKLGTGAYGGVYSVIGNPNKVVKIFNADDWPEVVKESSFAQDMKALDPLHFVQCFGIGRARKEGTEKNFAVFERADGVALSDAAHRYHMPSGINTVNEALEVLDQLCTIMINMMTPDTHGNLHFHLDLKADNIMVAKGLEANDEIKVTLIDYGVVNTCPSTDPAVKDSVFQMYRWLAWELLWVLSSEHFNVEPSAARDTPWEQSPEGFSPFFKCSDLRPAAYRTDKLSPGAIESAMRDAYFEQVMSPAFRRQWADPAAARRKLGKLLGDMFYGVALASDHSAFEPDFPAIRAQLRELKSLARPCVA